MMKLVSLTLLAGVAFIGAPAAQQPAHGSNVTRAFHLVQATPQGENKSKEKKTRGRKHGHRADASRPAHKSQAKKDGKSGKPKQAAEEKPEKPAEKNGKSPAKPAATKLEKPPHARSRETNEPRDKKMHQRQRSEHQQNTTEQAPSAAAQKAAPKESPVAGAPTGTPKKTEQVKPESGKPNQTKESAKPAPQKTQQVEQDKAVQPLAKPAKKTEVKPAAKPAEKTEVKPSAKPAEKTEVKPAAKPTKKAAEQPAPKTAQQPAAGNASTNVASPPPPTKPRSADAFIRRRGQKPGEDLNAVRRSRHETRKGNRMIIREGDRTIERENDRAIIRHSESSRFAVGARRVDVQHHGDRTVTIVVRPDGVQIVSTTDRHGHLIRRVRRDRHGHKTVIIDDSRFAPHRRNEIFVDVPPPRIRNHDRYIVEADHADRRRIYKVFTAPPIKHLRRHYTVDQVRYSYPLREYMPRVDLDIHFDTGSWQLTPDQIDRLGEIAAALNEAIDHNPREVYLIEGYTDAVGSWEDNLSLSDRRAEAVAVALTEQFHVPPENLVTQGYGEANLKVQTQGPSRINRRVAVRRITPLIAGNEPQDRR